MVKKATIKAKVLSVCPKGNHEWVLLVLIKEFSYIRTAPQEREIKGKVVFDDFCKRTKFNIVLPQDEARIFENRLSELAFDDVIKFSIVSGISYWHLSSLDTENCFCFDNSLDAIVLNYGQEE